MRSGNTELLQSGYSEFLADKERVRTGRERDGVQPSLLTLQAVCGNRRGSGETAAYSVRGSVLSGDEPGERHIFGVTRRNAADRRVGVVFRSLFIHRDHGFSCRRLS